MRNKAREVAVGVGEKDRKRSAERGLGFAGLGPEENHEGRRR